MQKHVTGDDEEKINLGPYNVKPPILRFCITERALISTVVEGRWRRNEMNTARRNAKADMTGKVCVLTGCRVKIGYQTALALLRMGATVVGTTRFPEDALRRFRAETDGADITTRLRLHTSPPGALDEHGQQVDLRPRIPGRK